jgi:hypothetical protein
LRHNLVSKQQFATTICARECKQKEFAKPTKKGPPKCKPFVCKSQKKTAPNREPFYYQFKLMVALEHQEQQEHQVRRELQEHQEQELRRSGT